MYDLYGRLYHLLRVESVVVDVCSLARLLAGQHGAEADDNFLLVLLSDGIIPP